MIYPARLTSENTLSRASLESFTRADLLDYFTLELEPMLRRCRIAGQPICYQGVYKSYTKKLMIERVLKLQETILKYQASEIPAASIEPAIAEEATASDIATIRDDLKRVHREMSALDVGSPDWEAKKIRIFSLSAQLQALYDLEAGKTVLTSVLPGYFSTEAAARREGYREVSRLARRGVEVRAWRLVTHSEQFATWGEGQDTHRMLGKLEDYYRVEIDEVIKVSDLLDAED